MGKRQDDKNLSILASIYHSCMKFKKIEALPEELQAILETKFENISGMNEKERSINQMLEGIAFRYSLENRAEMKMELEKEFDYICRTLEELFNMPIFEKLEIKVGKFGSLVNGFATDDADLDITICTNCYIKETFILEMVSGFLSKKLDIKNKTYDNPNYVSNASVPVVKITRNSPLTIKTDIIVNNVCGIINSRYLRVYSDMSKSVKYLGILLKLWAKKKGLIDQKMLSSYSFVLMMIYYLVKKGVVPNILRDVNTTDFQETAVNVKRFKNSNEEKFFIPTFFDFNLNTKKKFRFSLYEHLKGFAEYYGPGGEFWDTPTVISMLPTTRELEEDKIWTINDPFDTPHNPGRARLSDKSMFMNEFEDAFKKFESLEMTKIEALFT
jgi:DNA polymerase sigma